MTDPALRPTVSEFDSNGGDSANSTASLLQNPRIAALWDDLRTNGAGNDIFIDSSAGQVKFGGS